MSVTSKSLVGKKIVGVIWSTMSSNNRTVNVHAGLVLVDERGRRSVLRWSTIEETDGACYGTELVYPGLAVVAGEDVRPKTIQEAR